SVNWSGYCHCDSCRRNCASPVTAFFGVPNGSWSWSGVTPGEYAHSGHATRYFCKTCGTPLAYASTRWPNEIHFYAASLVDPTSFTPKQHFHYGERLPWLRLEDDLPKHHSSADELHSS
ncbi:MAG: GFA family protein, partial [Gammaproteobacteria bacterium]|nr:GFA family protein [Gammaproteobacteria bacterium]